MRSLDRVPYSAIVPVSSDDLELAPQLTDPQAERLWRQIEDERASGAPVLTRARHSAGADGALTQFFAGWPRNSICQAIGSGRPRKVIFSEGPLVS